MTLCVPPRALPRARRSPDVATCCNPFPLISGAGWCSRSLARSCVRRWSWLAGAGGGRAGPCAGLCVAGLRQVLRDQGQRGARRRRAVHGPDRGAVRRQLVSMHRVRARCGHAEHTPRPELEMMWLYVDTMPGTAPFSTLPRALRVTRTLRTWCQAPHARACTTRGATRRRRTSCACTYCVGNSRVEVRAVRVRVCATVGFDVSPLPLASWCARRASHKPRGLHFEGGGLNWYKVTTLPQVRARAQTLRCPRPFTFYRRIQRLLNSTPLC